MIKLYLRELQLNQTINFEGNLTRVNKAVTATLLIIAFYQPLYRILTLEMSETDLYIYIWM